MEHGIDQLYWIFNTRFHGSFFTDRIEIKKKRDIVIKDSTVIGIKFILFMFFDTKILRSVSLNKYFYSIIH